MADLRQTWESYRDNSLEQLGNHCRGGNVLTDAARAKGKRAEDIFAGPWHHWATLITEDAREWFDANGRMTWGDFMQDMKPATVDLRARERGAAAVRNLEQLRMDLAVRHEWIIQAREAGVTWPELETATGMTRVALNNIVKKHNDGKLP
jgi:hypothetical protein